MKTKVVYKSSIERPALDKQLDSKTFRNFYYLKEELVDFCRENGLPVSGGKLEISDRIAYFLDTGQKIEKLKRILFVQKGIGHFLGNT